jgi:acetylornithine/succinyldiaminopimelate/putrescine aminotransferase/predicted amino acid dehydrogenase
MTGTTDGDLGRGDSLSDRYSELNRPKVGQLLKLLKLDQVYETARGDALFYRDRDRMIEVLDLLGGYGSTILGHNHPAIAAVLHEELRLATPFHAQLSVRGGATLLAEELDDLIARKSGEKRRYVCTLGNSGAEAVEAALKHALLAWGNRRDELALQLARRAVRSGAPAAGAAPEVESARPVFIAFEGSFHGKTAGSVSVTWNESFRAMYPSGGVEVVFIRRDDAPESLPALLDRFAIGKLSRVAGIIYEPIQCEGGVHPIPGALLRRLALEARARLIPLIADEIQTGLWRTGRFLASHAAGVSPDYLLLGKGLGGGLAKISALLIDSKLYDPGFSMIHTSTYAEDDLSAAVALRAVRLLRDEQDRVARGAEAFESLVRERVEIIQRKYPGVIRELRGSGFLFGIQFDFSHEGQSPDIMYAIHQSGFASYLLASYLLNRHRVRVGVTLSATDTIRVEPSSYVSDRDALKFLDALSELARLLHGGHLVELTRHFWRCPLGEEGVAVRSGRSRKPAITGADATAVFLAHVIDEKHLTSLDPMFSPLPAEERQRFLDKFAAFADPFCYHEQLIEGLNGRKVCVKLVGVLASSEFFERSLRRDQVAFEKVRAMASKARELGASYLGLGQYTSIVSENGLLLAGRDLRVTTGNSLTAGLAYQALLQALEQKGLRIEEARIGVVGATGNIGCVLAQLLGDRAGALRLVYREPLAESRKFREALESVLAHSRISPDRVDTSHEPASLLDCDAVVVGTNSTRALIEPEHLKPDAIVLDVSVPSNVSPRVLAERPDVLCFQGGLARLPLGQSFDVGWLPTPRGETFACLAETVATALAGRTDDFSVGAITKERVLEAMAMADAVGITLGSPRAQSNRRPEP